MVNSMRTNEQFATLKCMTVVSLTKCVMDVCVCKYFCIETNHKMKMDDAKHYMELEQSHCRNGILNLVFTK